MIQKYTVFPLVIMGILILFPVSFAKAAGDQQGIQQLIDKEGKPMIIEVIMELRHGEITIIRGTGFDTHF
ncbi:MAG: hypothetical protein GTO02_17620, partial [Candidatus Dadabacteria bacterium]|nr:hypothetical protein [Candidatus Dadabacteria bacterium]